MRTDDFEQIPNERAAWILERLNGEPFAELLALRFEEIRRDYARCMLPFRPVLLQGAGLVHGGAVASLLDTVAIGAILSVFDTPPRKLVTLSLSIQLLDAVADEDVVAEARIRRRGGRITFVDVEARTAAGREIAHAEIVAAVETTQASPPQSGL